MNFIYANQPSETPTFGDVEDNQFFVAIDGFLCQKTSNSTFTVIAYPDGTPYSNFIDHVGSDRRIQRIIPKVEKIEF